MDRKPGYDQSKAGDRGWARPVATRATEFAWTPVGGDLGPGLPRILDSRSRLHLLMTIDWQLPRIPAVGLSLAQGTPVSPLGSE
jgi:hypothetical protein